MELHLFDRRPIVRSKAPAVKWFKEWFPDDFLVRLVLLAIGILVLYGFLVSIEWFYYLVVDRRFVVQRYFSNLYPKAESHQICNWCLKKESASSTTLKEEEMIDSSTSISSSSHNNDCKVDKDNNNNNNDSKIMVNNCNQYLLKGHDRGGTHNDSSNHHLHHRHQIFVGNKPIKRHRSPPDLLRHHHHHKEGSLIRIPKFEENRITKKVFRGRIQRYKLLEEVCR
ncbi:hypothetical protein Scep_010167 [Stephania cephalantha]|uniref:Uncharacterized protein n=1 Tax=Stephania cephalantha TaxID=152367 RepID=A0AAP0PGZ2_9MAGN